MEITDVLHLYVPLHFNQATNHFLFINGLFLCIEILFREYVESCIFILCLQKFICESSGHVACLQHLKPSMVCLIHSFHQFIVSLSVSVTHENEY